jgi:hypothetical protein
MVSNELSEMRSARDWNQLRTAFRELRSARTQEVGKPPPQANTKTKEDTRRQRRGVSSVYYLTAWSD